MDNAKSAPRSRSSVGKTAELEKLRRLLILSFLAFIFSSLLSLYFYWQLAGRGGQVTLPEETARKVEIKPLAKPLSTYRSNRFGYEVSYDPEIWQESNCLKDSNQCSLSAKDALGLDSAYLIISVAYGKVSTYQELAKEKGGGELPPLEAYVYITKKSISETTKKVRFLKEEKVNKNGRDFIKLIWEEPWIGETYLTRIDYYLVADEYPFGFRLTGSDRSPNFSRMEEIVFNNIKTFPRGEAEQKVKGTSTVSEAEITKVVAKVKPAVVRILTKYCASLSVRSLEMGEMYGKSYPFCVGGYGTGFFVNSEGYIATNGHVAKLFPEDALIAAVSYYGEPRDFLVDLIILSTRAAGAELNRFDAQQAVEQMPETPGAIDQMTEAVFTLYTGKAIEVTDEDQKSYVQLGKFPFVLDTSATSGWSIKTNEDVREASLVDYNYASQVTTSFSQSMGGGFLASDVALLKISGAGDYPIIKLEGAKEVPIGSEILVVGFPGAATDLKGVLDESASTKQTVTRGIISSVKKAAGTKTELLQTDASVTHGNSGGPGINLGSRAVGIATYGTPADGTTGNYNFLITIKDLQDLLEKNGVENKEGKTSPLWDQALEDYWSAKYRKAVKKFEEVKKLYPQHPDVGSYLKECEAKIAKGEDKSGFEFSSQNIPMIVGVSLSSISLVVLVVVLLKFRRGRAAVLATPSPAPPLAGQPPIPVVS